MKKLLRAILLTGTISVLFFAGSVVAVNAQVNSKIAEQCSGNTNCLSLDVTKNPLLKGYTVVTTNDSKGKPTEHPTDGTCVLYKPPGSFGQSESGCLKNGVFTLGSLGSAAGGSETLVKSALDSTGKESAEQVGTPGSAGSGKCGWDDIGQCFLNIPGYFIGGIGYFLLTISSIMLGIAGAVFNWVIIRTVFQFALYFGTSEGMLVAWGVLRDIANIGLLFGFVFMGIATILNTHSMEGFTAKKALPRLIIFAVLLNFSLFATQGIIDVANGFSSVFATYAATDCSGATSSDAGGGQTNKDCSNAGISGKVLTAAGMNHVVPSGPEAIKSLVQMAENPYTYGTMLIILSLLVSITAIVLFAAAIMLIVRVVILSLLMVTSPIGFAGMVIPGLHGIANDWWKKLINQAFFAPIFLLMVFISLKLVESLQNDEINIADALMGNGGNGLSIAGNMQVLVVFAVVIGFMIAALVVAQKMGAYGASFATNTASAFIYGSMARGSNLLAGGAGRGVLALQRRTGIGGKTGNRIANTINRTAASSNLDLRRAPGMGGILGAAGITAGAKPAEHATFTDMGHQLSKIKSGNNMKELAVQADKDEARHKLEEEGHHDTTSPASVSMSKDSVDLLNGLSVKELAALHGIQEGVGSLAAKLAPEKFDKLMDGDELTASQKQGLRSARSDYFTSPKGAALITAMKPEVSAKLSPSLITKNTAGAGAAPSYPVLTAMNARQLGRLNPDDFEAASLTIVGDYIKAERIAGTAKGREFDLLRSANPNIDRKWSAYVV